MSDYLEKVQQERERQLTQGKSEDNGHLTWHLVVADQLALVTRTLSLTRYHGVRTSAEEPRLDPIDRHALKLGLVRVGACAQAWYEALEREGDDTT